MRRLGLAKAFFLAGLLLASVPIADGARTSDPTWTGTWASPEWGTMQLTQTGASVEGTYTHDQGHIKGTVSGNVLTGRWDEAPTRQGPGDAGEVILTGSGKSFTGKWNYDGDKTLRTNWSGTCTAGPCLQNGGEAEPKLPDALVPIASVSNGCGGGKATLERRFGDTSTYLDSNNPAGKRYLVNFREACNLHDAGYSGARVRDVLHGGKIIDFFTWTQLEVDNKFLQDMLLICNRSISALADSALADCRNTGGKTSLGARSRYNFVRDAGDLFYQERPKLRGFWQNRADRAAPAWAIVHSIREVKASWSGGSASPSLRGQFKGTLITRDDDSIVSGFATITETGKPTLRNRPMRLTWNPDQPDRLLMSGPGGPLGLERE